MNLVIVSGRSGSGKSIVLNLLEDLSYYCIDNLPLDFLPALPQTLDQCYKKVAVSVDARNLASATVHIDETLKQLHQNYARCDIVFLDANEDILLRRFSETRRKHPLTNTTTNLHEALKKERLLLQPLEQAATLRLDTSQLTVHQLRALISESFQDANGQLSILFQSFGFRYGVPQDTDYIFDVRCLPNPYWEPLLRDQSGLDQPVIDYLEQLPAVSQMLKMIKDFIERWLPDFKRENRRYLTISIGCTGGQHRSVYLAEQLARYFSQKIGQSVNVRHRDLSS
ncbi:MAG: RNase adaptor protein RapZ [Gammaproteobacteria bacterium GWE2_42_36]|nr:MAG: RNase adaptor protein RapZ [Gammaproteobacteria bacterium GWE2_42_36]HCU05326.1 RNase adapter RapZ [Coxiellaceae bacterium]